MNFIGWRYNNTDLLTTEKHRIEMYPDGNHKATLSLRVMDITYADYGNYTCFAQNNLGSDEKTMLLYDHSASDSSNSVKEDPCITDNKDISNNVKDELCINDNKKPTECKEDELGFNYDGTISVTKYGRTCQAWSKQIPQDHMYRFEELADHQNYCRNRDNEPGGPWCYTTDPNVRWEYCDVPYCDVSHYLKKDPCITDKKGPKECIEDRRGLNYNGTRSVTTHGRTCKAWRKHAEDLVDHQNYCRNPDNDFDGPWCYTTDPYTEWEYCELPYCVPPEIVLPNRRIGQSPGRETTLECQIKAFPLNFIGWRYNNKDLLTTEKHRIFMYRDGNHRVTLSLRVLDITHADYGNYTCFAQNNLGSDEKTMSVYDNRPRLQKSKIKVPRI